jgi:hypothetical protein
MSVLSCLEKQDCAMEASHLSLNLRHSFGRFQEMQDGVYSDGVKVANDHMRPSGEDGSGTVYHSSQGGDGDVLPLNRNTVGDGGRGNSCASSRSERAADSGAVRHGAPGSAHEPGVESVERRDPVPRLRHGSLSVSLMLAQRATAEGAGGPIISARQISLRFALRFGQGRCLHVPPKGQEGTWVGPGRVAHVMVLGDTHPRSHLMRAWTKQHPRAIYLRNTEDPNGEGANETNPNTPKGGESFTPPQHDGSGQQEPALSPVIIRAGAGTGEVPSAGTLGGIPFTPAPKRRCVGTSIVTLDENRCSSARRVRKPLLAVQQT